MGLQIILCQGISTNCCEVQINSTQCKMKIRIHARSTTQMHSCEFSKYHQCKRSGGRGYNFLESSLEDDYNGTPLANTGDDLANDIEFKRLKVIHWDVYESEPQQCGLEASVLHEGDNSQALHHTSL